MKEDSPNDIQRFARDTILSIVKKDKGVKAVKHSGIEKLGRLKRSDVSAGRLSGIRSVKGRRSSGS